MYVHNNPAWPTVTQEVTNTNKTNSLKHATNFMLTRLINYMINRFRLVQLRNIISPAALKLTQFIKGHMNNCF